MLKNAHLFTLFLFVILSTVADYSEAAEAGAANETKELSGMSILGNSEAPKSLVIVPWKTSEIGDGIGVANMLDGRARAVDKEVFVRELGYYELRIELPQKAPGQPASSVAQQ